MRRLIRGLTALVALVAIIAGIPALLMILGADALPHTVPSPADIKVALTNPDTGQLFIGFLVIVAWIAWAYFTLSILTELVAQLARRPQLRIPGLSFGRAQVSGLVAAIAAVIVVGPTASALAAPVPLAHQTAPASHTQTVAASTQTTTAAATRTAHTTHAGGQAGSEAARAAAANPQAPTALHNNKPSGIQHKVQPGETLWGLAEHYYGADKGSEYTRIVAANPGLNPDAWLPQGRMLTIPGVPAAATAKPAKPHADKTVTVERGDTLSEIAQEELGNANQWPAIADKSRGIVQPDGHRLTDPNMIRPGWKVVVPGAGEAITPPKTKPVPPEVKTPVKPTVKTPVKPTVKPTAKPTQEQTVEPTQKPTLKPAVKPTVEPTHEAEQTTKPTAEPTQLPTQVPTAVPTQKPATPPAAHETTQSPTAQHETQTPATNNASGNQSEDSSSNNEIIAHPVQTALGAGALLCAGLLALVATRRRRQLRRRQPGQQIPQLPEEFEAIEHEMRTVARPVTRNQVNRALRTLAHLIAQADGAELPRLKYMVHADERIILHLDRTPADAPTPFIADGNTWTLHRDNFDQLLDGDAAAAIPAPYPALINIGTDADDNFVLVDLEHLAALTLDMDQEQSEGIIASIAGELATSLWADDLLVTLVGSHRELPKAIGNDRARYLETPDDLLTSLRSRLRIDRALLTKADYADAFTARRHEPSDWPPEVILLGTALTDAEQAELAQLLTDLPRVAIAVVSAGGDPITDWVLAATSPTATELRPVSVPIAPHMLRGDDYTAALQMLELSQRTDTTPAPWWDHTIPMPDEEDGLDEPELPPVIVIPTRPSVPAEDSPASAVALAMPAPLTAVVPNTNGEAAQEPMGAAEGTAEATPMATDEPSDGNRDTAVDTAGSPAAGESHNTQHDAPDTDSATPDTDSATPDAIVHAFPTPVPSITLFGEPAIHSPAGDVVDHRRIGQLTRAAVYLALNPNAATTEMDRALGISSDTRASIISRLRKWLGQAPDGELYVPKLGRRVGLHEDVRSDWDHLQDLIVGGVNATATISLVEALRLVTGPPILEPEIDRYDFASSDREHITAVVRDTALTLAERSIASGDIDQARIAITKGYLIDPDDESFARAEIRVERLAGNKRKVQEIISRLTANARRHSIDLEDKTVALLNDIKRAHG